MKDLLLLVPRLARMIGSILADREAPPTIKLVLAALALYLASPVDLIPDLIPFAGLLDDLLLAAIVVDGLLNHLDRSFVLKHWPGSVSSLDAAAAVARRLSAWVPSRVKGRIFGARRAV